MIYFLESNFKEDLKEKPNGLNNSWTFKDYLIFIAVLMCIIGFVIYLVTRKKLTTKKLTTDEQDILTTEEQTYLTLYKITEWRLATI